MPRVENHTSEIVPKLTGLHLFHYDVAPCAQRVRFVLAEKGVQRGPDIRFDDVTGANCSAPAGTWASRIVSLIKKDHFTDTYARIQPNLVIPALVHDGELYIESMDIIEYLDGILGGDRMVPDTQDPRSDDVRHLTELGKKLHQSIRYVSYRWGAGRMGKITDDQQDKLERLLENGADGENLAEFYRTFSNDLIPQDVFDEHLCALSRGFQELETRLQDGRAFLTGNTVTMADAIWSMKVIRLEEMGYPTGDLFPAVAEWFDRIAARPSHAVIKSHYRTMRGVFKTRAWIEQKLDTGLPRAARELACA